MNYNSYKITVKLAESLGRIAVASEPIYKISKFFNFIEDPSPCKILPMPTIGVRLNPSLGRLDCIYNPEFVDSLPEEKLDGVLTHEALHFLMEHLTTRIPDEVKQNKNLMFMLNIAQDLAINSLIPEKMLPEDGAIPGKGIFKNLEPFKDAEEYFSILYKQHQQDLKKFKEAVKKLLQDSHEWGNSQGKPLPQKLQDILDEVTQELGLKDIKEKLKETPKPTQPKEIPKYGYKVDQAQEVPENNSQGQGAGQKDQVGDSGAFVNRGQHQPGSSAGTGVDYAMLKERLFPRPALVDWKHWVRQLARQRQSWETEPSRKKYNRRFAMDFPGEKKRFRRKKIACYVDVSPSVPRDMVMEFVNEVKHLLRYVDLDLGYFGYTMCGPLIKDIKKNYNFGEIPAAGGTSFTAPIENWLKESGDEFCVVITDGEANLDQTIPAGKKSKVTWVLPHRQYRLGFGEQTYGKIIYMR